jgi:M3 family oligoendopeptidase
LDRTAISSRYDAIDAELRESATAEQTLGAFARWERLRREIAAWKERAYVGFRQNTADPDALREQQRLDELDPFFEERDGEIKRRLLRPPHREPLESKVGPFTLARWEAAVAAFAPGAEGDLLRESRLSNRYTQLTGGAMAVFRGVEYTLAGLRRFDESPDRALRREACETGWGWYDDNASDLDETFDGLVAARTSMARTCGYENYTGLSFKRLARVGYGPEEISRFREEIRESIVPMAAAFAAQQAEAIGVDALMPWDEEIFDRLPPPAPPAGTDAAAGSLRAAARAIHPEIGAFSDLMRGGERMDIESRPGKSSGAFCAFLHDDAMPFLFASYTGKAGDCATLLHEMGHAFQNYRSREYATMEQILPTLEICEIHSMALEFLAWPYYDRFFDEGFERFRAAHVRSSIKKLPYMAAIDHFQKLVYANPSASPAQRNAMWLEMEARYLPWKDAGGIPALARGAAWQRQRHVYVAPFYYIDYAIAACCALQLWDESLHDSKAATQRYLALCDLGGTLPLGELLDAVSLLSPFQSGVLARAASGALNLGG